ncbi:MAG: flagellar basal body P-ring formation protein FlgA [Planctomycetes bacterium]|nr:flagellar basal body P-ring formation protein FlgA [Planctomycetota bacterium]
MHHIILSFALLFGGQGPESRPAPAIITLKREATVRGADYTLADVAEIRGSRAADLAKIKIGYSPAPGSERRLMPTAVDVKITSAGFARDQFQIAGNGTVVRSETVTIIGKTLGARILSELQSSAPANAIVELPAEVNDMSVTAPRSPGTIVETTIVKPAGALRGDAKATVKVSAGGECLGVSEIPVRYRYEMEVLVAAIALHSGESPDAAKFIKKKMDVTHVDGDPVADLSALVGRMLARSIAKDRILTSQDLTLAPVYRRGDQARVVIERGTLRIEALVRVEGDAFIGSRVSVTCLEFNKTLVARVREDGVLDLSGDIVVNK